jgi:adenylylsulfate kinase-like enzyme
LRQRLMPHLEKSSEDRRRASGRISRTLRLLRAHRLIRKVSTTSYYRVTSHGQHLMSTALRLREVSIHTLAA